jgi:two-component system sensor histidine kinase RpfC
VLGVGMSDNERARIAANLAGWGGKFCHTESLAKLLLLLRQIPSDGQRNHVVLCRPQALRIKATDFASIVWAEFAPSKVSLIMLDGDPDGNNSEPELLKMGYACLLRTPIDKTLLFNALHSVLSTKTEAEDVVSFMKHYEQNSLKKLKLNILLAEDNETNRKIIMKILEYAGHSIELVENGEEALDLLEDRTYDLAIMDMNMPVMGGLEALKIYRMTAGMKPRMPIIILTANATLEAKRECEEAGGDAFLTKPIDASTLLETVARLSAAHHHVAAPPTPASSPKPMISDQTTVVEAHGLLVNENTLHQLKLLGGANDNFLEGVIQGFFLEGERTLEAMKSALLMGEYDTFQELAHALKGSSGNLGAEALFQICREISMLNHHEWQASSQKLLRRAQESFGSTRQTMTRYLETLQQAIVP